MSSVADHYSSLLAPVYLWMAGGLEAAVALGTQDVAEYTPGHGVAVDLGAGFGMHSIPLARAGYKVLAIDTSAVLLDVLRKSGAGLSIRAVEMDLLRFKESLADPANLIVCMGDTLTHLDSIEQVKGLAQDVRGALTRGGKFVATFRDYSNPATGEARFIPVRSDSDRILTCFLEQGAQHMRVHDLLHERDGTSWKLRVSSYKKLRLSPDDVAAIFGRTGMDARLDKGPRGMVRLVADA